MHMRSNLRQLGLQTHIAMRIIYLARSVMLPVALFAVANVFSPGRSFASPGSPDTTFNGTGKATASINTFRDVGNGVNIQSDGKIVIAGYSLYNSSNSDFVVIRFNINGPLDSAFNNTGKVITHFGVDSSGHGI